MENINVDDVIKAIFVINGTTIFVSCSYTGQYSEYNGETMYWFINTKTDTEYPFTKKQLADFADANERHDLDTIEF